MAKARAQAIAGDASLIVADACLIQRDEATVDLDARRRDAGAAYTRDSPNDSDGGMQGTLASVCTLAVIRDGAELRPRFLAEQR
jgi:hypothetical protein